MYQEAFLIRPIPEKLKGMYFPQSEVQQAFFSNHEIPFHVDTFDLQGE